MSMIRYCVRSVAAMVLVSLLSGIAQATNLYVLQGTFRQHTTYAYTVTATPADTFYISTTVPLPHTNTLLGHRQKIVACEIIADPIADSGWQMTDSFGTVWSTTEWYYVPESTVLTRQVECIDETTYGNIVTSSGYPVSTTEIPSSVKRWLEADSVSQSTVPEIVRLAEELARDTRTQIEVVGRILGWIRANVEYSCSRTVCVPVFEVNALFTLQNRIGNCVNFANLAIALLRAAGIPAMPVCGFVADRAESHAGHAWIAAYFPDRGWVEFETANWIPAYGEVPVTFLLPQHITLYYGEGEGVCNALFTELHTAEFTITDRPVAVSEVSAQIAAGEAVSWVATLDSPYDEITTFALHVDGVPRGWHTSLSECDVTIDPDGVADTCDILFTVYPSNSVRTGTEATITLYAETADGEAVGAVVAEIQIIAR